MVMVTHGFPRWPISKLPTEPSLCVGALYNVKPLLNQSIFMSFIKKLPRLASFHPTSESWIILLLLCSLSLDRQVQVLLSFSQQNRSLQPKLPFLSPSWEIHVHVSCLSSGSLQWVTLHVYSNTHTEAWTSPNMKGHMGIFTAISPSLACESNVYKTLSEKRE